MSFFIPVPLPPDLPPCPQSEKRRPSSFFSFGFPHFFPFSQLKPESWKPPIDISTPHAVCLTSSSRIPSDVSSFKPAGEPSFFSIVSRRIAFLDDVSRGGAALGSSSRLVKTNFFEHLSWLPLIEFRFLSFSCDGGVAVFPYFCFFLLFFAPGVWLVLAFFWFIFFLLWVCYSPNRGESSRILAPTEDTILTWLSTRTFLFEQKLFRFALHVTIVETRM